jgi:ABC-type nitrate/sulfonate/bicarbonate transport system substrate-binding protein
MPVTLTAIKAELFPGLAGVLGQYPRATQWEVVFKRNAANVFVPQTPHIWIPQLTMPEALAVGAAATVIQNPVVTRRFWQGWLK